MATPSAQGTALKVSNAPTFTAFVVAAGTWKKKDTTEVKPFRGGAKGQTVAVSFADPGAEYSCEWAVVSGQTPAKVGDVVTDGSSVKYLVTACEDSNFGETEHMQTVTLLVKEGLTLT